MPERFSVIPFFDPASGANFVFANLVVADLVVNCLVGVQAFGELPRGDWSPLARMEQITRKWGQKMGRMGTFLFGMIAGFFICYVSNHYHVVRSESGVFVIPKINQNLNDTYVDTRNFKLSDWQNHRMLAASILRSDRKELLDDSALSGFRTSVGSLLSHWAGE